MNSINLASIDSQSGRIFANKSSTCNSDSAKNFHFVVDCSKHVMRDHCYWPLVSDLSNLLSHRPVALQFLSDDSLLEMWFSFLSMFQGD